MVRYAPSGRGVATDGDEMHLEKLGERVFTFRTKLGMSQRELGRRAGVHHTTIGRLEDGGTNIGIMELLRIAEALECEVIELLGYDVAAIKAAAEELFERPNVSASFSEMAIDLQDQRPEVERLALSAAQAVMRSIIQTERERTEDV